MPGDAAFGAGVPKGGLPLVMTVLCVPAWLIFSRQRALPLLAAHELVPTEWRVKACNQPASADAQMKRRTAARGAALVHCPRPDGLGQCLASIGQGQVMGMRRSAEPITCCPYVAHCTRAAIDAIPVQRTRKPGPEPSWLICQPSPDTLRRAHEAGLVRGRDRSRWP